MKKEIQEVIDVLAENFGSTGEHLYQVMVYQAYILGIRNVFLLAIFSFLWFYFLPKSTQAIKEGIKEDKESQVVINIIVIISAIIPSAIFICDCVAHIPTLLLNPEYWVLQQVLNLR